MAQVVFECEYLNSQFGCFPSSVELWRSEALLKNPSCACASSPCPRQSRWHVEVPEAAFVRLWKPQTMFMTDLYAINAKENNHYMCVCLPARPMWVQNVAVRIHKDGIKACVCCGWDREGVQIVFRWHGQHLDTCGVPRFKLKNPTWMSPRAFPNVSLSCWRLTGNNPDCDLWWDANVGFGSDMENFN